MKNLSVGQKRALSDFFNTTAAAWFTAGLITPLFSSPQTLKETLLPPLAGILLTYYSLQLSMES